MTKFTDKIHHEFKDIICKNKSSLLVELYKKYHDQFPQKLYRYMPIESYTESNLKMLLDGNFSLSDFKTFNDPLDTHILKIVHHHLNSNHRYTNNMYDNSRKVLNSILVKCLSAINPTEVQSMRMWAYYADSHKGVCVEYDAQDFINFVIGKHDEFNAQGYQMPLCWFFPINYISEISMSNYKQKMHDATWPITLFEKRDCWSHEEEWRIFYGHPDLFKNNYEDRSIKISPRKIYLGCNISGDMDSRIKKIFSGKDVKIENVAIGNFMDWPI